MGNRTEERRSRTWHKTLGGYAASMAIGLVLWEATVWIFDLPGYLLPPPSDVLPRMIADFTTGPNLLYHSWVTAVETFLGLGLAIVVGVPLAILITYSRIAATLLYPGMVVSQVVPKVAIAPVVIVWLGFGIFPKVVISFLIAFFVVVVDTSVGLASVDPNMIFLARSMGASEFGTFHKVRLPHALPNFFGGLKVAVTLSLVGAITAELVGSNAGLGYVVLVGLGAFDLELMFGSILLMGIVGIILFAIVQIIERLSIPWSRGIRLEELITGGSR